jgi:hypothetical protein
MATYDNRTGKRYGAADRVGGPLGALAEHRPRFFIGRPKKWKGKLVTSAPTVSVITISFQDLDGLKRTVDSVRAQRYEGRIEHIVIDGGSGDDVVKYLSEIEPGFAYWQSEPDGDGMTQ